MINGRENNLIEPLRTILEEFLKSANEIKDLELHFTMGEATVYAAMGTRSPVGRDLWRVEERDFAPIGRDQFSTIEFKSSRFPVFKR